MLSILLPLASFGFGLLSLCILYALGRIVITLNGLANRHAFALAGVRK